MIRTYTELSKIRSFRERYEYLRLGGTIGQSTFGWHRYMNQVLYASKKWKKARDEVIIRDDGCDLAHPDYEIRGKLIVHHMNPITIDDLEYERDIVFDPELLICTSDRSHNAIHYGDETLLPQLPIERRPGDTCPWR